MSDPRVDRDRIVEAVPVPQAGLIWIRRSDDHTAEIASGAVSTVGELMSRLAHIPSGTPLLVDGYEGGFTTVSAVVITRVQQLDRDPDQAMYQGEYETTAEAQRQASLSPDDPELAVGSLRPPLLFGDPMYAVVLRRAGR
ncbi:Uncharacterised protein [Mycobacteroides abscessus subsp. abscessus]|uniref:hypothetical protein n=1 Tax=Mycobacteroides abscessus TaxID=36809 RepID=UPI0009A87546|nr:hypothetical protein [Mycobacteroides abscessus]SKM39824.1 Uncharacterised protein [Mycobacteroides abscessus subsp. abscessus]